MKHFVLSVLYFAYFNLLVISDVPYNHMYYLSCHLIPLKKLTVDH